MIYKAQPEFTQTLLSLPESGMGYQIVDARRFGKPSAERFIVYNCTLIVSYDDSFSTYKNNIKNEGYSAVLQKALEISLFSPTLAKRSELWNQRNKSEYLLILKGRHTSGKGAVDSTPIYGNGKDTFVRLSAYADDMRIDVVNKRLVKGTYTTTEDDYLDCKTGGDDPVDRYALPNDEPIQWTFWVKPKIFDSYKPGIVQPANGHNGGGVEDLFENGTSNGTYIERKPY